MAHMVDIAGQRFGKLDVVCRAPAKSADGIALWVVRCECGNFRYVRSSSLRSGNTKSCGCLHANGGIAAARNRRIRLAAEMRVEE